ncbi:hypothetical protein K474DRAFT_1661542 [Panus rudis PR-1116 ss-1]|nr:hypothetical protein K474DRAFT_1661542 [Panus rudis PR-1116 ss-1]
MSERTEDNSSAHNSPNACRSVIAPPDHASFLTWHAALKKKSNVKEVESSGELFSTDDSLFSAEDDLFSDDAPVEKNASESSNAPTRPRLSPEERSRRFNRLLKYVGDRIGQKPAVRDALQVRKTEWQHLFGLATTKEQLERVAELFPKWRDSRREFTPRICEAFVRRCEELHCPQLALKVFSDHPKYGFDLSSPVAARRLLHSLHVEHPLSDTITLTALYKVYNLPPISSDLVATAMLTSACFKAGTPESITVAKSLLPSLQKLLQETDPKAMEYPQDWKERSRTKEKTWLTWSLNKIEKALKNQGEEFDWLRQWRESSGHAQIAS